MPILRPDHIFRFNLDDLYDTDVPSPSNNQLLSYNTTSGKWEARTEASIPHAMSTHTDEDTYNIATSGTITCGKVTATAEALKLIGTATGNSNLCYLEWYDSDGTTRRGFIGDSATATDNITLRAQTGDLRFQAAGTVILPTGSTIGNLTLADGSITDSSNAISFGNEALSTTGTVTTDGLILNKATGKGIKIDTATPTFGWRDLLGDVFARNTGANKPTFTTYRDSLMDYQFAVGDEEYFKFHIPHDYVAATDIHLHVHWSHISADVNGGTVTFEYEISYAMGHSQAVFGASVGTTFPGTAATGAGGQYKHVISEVQISAGTPDGNQIDSDDLEPDGVIMARLDLNANNMTGATPEPFIHFVDIHYQSTNIGTKNKIFDFYA